MPLVEKRYAEALLKFSLENNSFDASINDFNIITDAYTNSFDLQNYLTNPKINKTEKKDLISKLFKENISEPMIRFVKLIIDKDRIKLLPEMFKEYLTLADKHRNSLNIDIYTALELDSKQVKALEKKYKQQYNKSRIRSKIIVDESLIGGIKVVIGDKVYDGSIKGQLEKLKNILTQVS